MDTNGLDEILNEAPAETEAPKVETPEAAKVEASPKADAEQAKATRDASGRFAPKGDEQAPAAAGAEDEGASPAPSEDQPLDHPALMGERRRRQEAERRLAEIEARAAAVSAPPAPPQRVAAPDPFDDPEGYADWLSRTVAQRARAETIAASQEERIMHSADAAREKYQDWAEKAAVFTQLARENQALEAQLRNHRNPAEYAYRTAKLQIELSQHGSLDALIAAREEAAKAAVRAELAAGTAPQADTPIPESLAGSQSARSAAVPQGPPTLDDILNPPRK